MTKTQIKEELLEECREFIQQRIDVSQKAMDNAQDSANNETKSSAGDKFETGRAMMQMEVDKNARQLSEASRVKLLLDMVNPEMIYDKVRFGSVVKTDLANYFIAISAGRIIVEDVKYYAISPQAPLAIAMLQKKVGDTISFNEKPLKILEVF